MSHPNARLTVIARGELVVEVAAGFTQAEVARRFRVSRQTVAKWVRRFRHEGPAGLHDRSSRPRRQPRRTPSQLEQRICRIRRDEGDGPGSIALALGLATSTVHAVLKRNGLQRLSELHRVSRAVVRYERERPGELVHLDVKKLGRIPPGGGKRVNWPDFLATMSGPKSRGGGGFDYMHVAIDDHSRFAYIEALADERGESTAAFLERAAAAFAARGVSVEAILTDNAKAYVQSTAFAAVLERLGIKHLSTRPYRPQTNGKAERLIRTMLEKWAYKRPYRSNEERLRALPKWLDEYNHRRPHRGIGGATPVSRL